MFHLHPPSFVHDTLVHRRAAFRKYPPSANFTDTETKEVKHEMTHSPTNLLKTPPVGTKPSPDGAS